MGYSKEQHGDRGLLVGEVDYDEYDELASLDMDYLEELGAVSCPSGQEYDRIEQMCRPVATSSTPVFKARLMSTAPATTTMAPAPTSPTTSRCPSGQEYDRIEQMCRSVATPTPTTTFQARFMTKAPAATVATPTREAPPDGVAIEDLLVNQPPPPTQKAGSFSSPFRSAIPEVAAPSVSKTDFLVMPAPPPSTASSGLSGTTKIAMGVGAGLLLLYIVTRKKK